MEILLVLLFATSIVAALAEYILLIKEKSRRLKKEVWLNVRIGLIGSGFNLLMKGLHVYLYHLLYLCAPFPITNKILAVVLAFVLFDFVTYWVHRFSHQNRFLWATHITHHSAKHFNLTVAFRIPFLSSTIKFIFWIPLALVGIPVEFVVLASLVTRMYAFFLHTECVRSYGILEYFFITPSHHRVHHGSNPEYLDKNFGEFLNIWDRMFGTFKTETVAPVYGVTENCRDNTVWKANFGEFKRLYYRVLTTPGWKNKMALLLSNFQEKALH